MEEGRRRKDEEANLREEKVRSVGKRQEKRDQHMMSPKIECESSSSEENVLTESSCSPHTSPARDRALKARK